MSDEDCPYCSAGFYGAHRWRLAYHVNEHRLIGDPLKMAVLSSASDTLAIQLPFGGSVDMGFIPEPEYSEECRPGAHNFLAFDSGRNEIKCLTCNLLKINNDDRHFCFRYVKGRPNTHTAHDWQQYGTNGSTGYPMYECKFCLATQDGT